MKPRKILQDGYPSEDPSSGLGNDAGSAWVNLQEEMRWPMPPPLDCLQQGQDHGFASSSAAGKGEERFWAEASSFRL